MEVATAPRHLVLDLPTLRSRLGAGALGLVVEGAEGLGMYRWGRGGGPYNSVPCQA